MSAIKNVLESAIVQAASRAPPLLTRLVVGRFCPIFMLHRLHDQESDLGHSRAQVARCLQFLHDRDFRPISLEALVQLLAEGRALPDRCVAFTIDDGFTDQVEVAGELFSAFDVPLTCFVITDFIDGNLWPWDDQVAYVLATSERQSFDVALPNQTKFTVRLAERAVSRQKIREQIRLLRDRLKSMQQDALYPWLQQLYRAAEVDVPTQPPPDYQPISWQDARRFVARGHSIAPHTQTHRILSQLSPDVSRNEIANSVRRVGEMLGVAPKVFAYPTGREGDFGDREMNILRDDFGMLGAVSTVRRAATANDNLMALPRFSLPTDMTQFVRYLTFIELAWDRFNSLVLGRRSLARSRPS